MCDDNSQKLSKPRMKGLLMRQTMINIGTAIGLAIATGFLVKIFVVDARRNKYGDFYSEYDPEAEIAAMLKLGADFQSFPDFR